MALTLADNFKLHAIQKGRAERIITVLLVMPHWRLKMMFVMISILTNILRRFWSLIDVFRRRHKWMIVIIIIIIADMMMLMMVMMIVIIDNGCFARCEVAIGAN